MIKILNAIRVKGILEGPLWLTVKVIHGPCPSSEASMFVSWSQSERHLGGHQEENQTERGKRKFPLRPVESDRWTASTLESWPSDYREDTGAEGGVVTQAPTGAQGSACRRETGGRVVTHAHCCLDTASVETESLSELWLAPRTRTFRQADRSRTTTRSRSRRGNVLFCVLPQNWEGWCGWIRRAFSGVEGVPGCAL